ncbi:MAG TPA: hypothetical protein PKW57_08675 [Anaerolineaceae bacterium]|jgi:hypothetical protein|nr:hypothetical protein [Anaerolineaceae bacterium]HPS33563.1 hypothetical protein [Anaerolineaceae bacterium]
MSKGIGKVVAGIITVVIGGTAFAISKTDVIKNFSEETGMTQQEAQQYIEAISEEELISFDQLGEDHITDGQDALNLASEIDCVKYQYEWESDTLSCEEGLAQYIEFGESSIALGESYKVLGSDSASNADIEAAIRQIDRFNECLRSEIIVTLMGQANADEVIKSNLYNKALLQTALESN